MAAAGGRCGISVLPRQYRSWISPRDPGFEAKATVILDLYQGFYQGRRLRPGDRILSVDAKPSIQARGRCHPTAPAAPGKPVRVEHEYVRHGALALLAALDVHTGKVFASTPATTEASRCPASWVRPRAQSTSPSDGVNASASSRPDTTRGNRGYAVRSTDVTRNSRDRNQPDAANLNDQASAAARFCRIPADPVMAVQLACGDRGNDEVLGLRGRAGPRRRRS